MPSPCPICRADGQHKMSCPVVKSGNEASQPPARIAELVDLLHRHTFSFSAEEELQEGIANVLEGAGIAFEREYHLDARNRPDFFLSAGIAIEVKVDGATSAVTRQLHRYAHHPDVRAIVLVTTRQRHRAIPRELNGKPVTVITLTESML